MTTPHRSDVIYALILLPFFGLLAAGVVASILGNLPDFLALLSVMGLYSLAIELRPHLRAVSAGPRFFVWVCIGVTGTVFGTSVLDYPFDISEAAAIGFALAALDLVSERFQARREQAS